MLKPFWNKKCETFSEDLWKPDNKDLKKSKKDTPYWNCDNKNISFTHYLPKKEIDNKIDFDFKPVPTINNKANKRKMFYGSFNVEIKRLETKIKKNKIIHSDITKYMNIIKKIQIDAEKNDNPIKKHKEFIIKIRKEFAFLKNKSSKINTKNKCYPVMTQHFEQVDKISEKMSRLDDVVYCKKVKILPDSDQQDIFISWVWNTIEIYNNLAEEFNNIQDEILKKYEETDKRIYYSKFLITELKKYPNFPIGGKNLRNAKIHSLTEKYSDIPFCVISDIIMEFASNLKGNLTKLGKGQINNFYFKPRKFGKKNKTIPIQQKYTSDKGFYPSIFGEIETDDADFDWKSICSDYKVVYDKYKHTFNLHIPSYKKVHIVEHDRLPIGIADPGMRTFQQLYGLDHIIAIGKNMYNPIMKKINKIESMERRIKDNSKARKNKRTRNKDSKRISNSTKKNLRRAISRTHSKIKDVVSEMHNKTSIFLCKTYDRIMVTDFSSKKVNGKEKGLQKNHKKVLGKLSHYRFRQRLAQKCLEYRCQYIEVTEEYTSKTCCRCGNQKNDLGTKKHYDCDKCNMSIDRDTNGAINIFIKNRSEVI